ncbi:hypothetical protein J7L48_09505 [bacterium]|nr:hypothetical protein [bacterium]
MNFGFNIYEFKNDKWEEISNFYNNEKVNKLYITKDFITVVNNQVNTVLSNRGSYYKKISCAFEDNEDFLFGIYFENGYVYEKSNEPHPENLGEKFYGVYIPESRVNDFVENIEKFKKMGFNGVVFPLKTDKGNILFKPKSHIFYETGAYRYNKNWKRILRTLHKNNFKAVARIVCFKDEVLFKYENSKYTFWDKKNMKPWQGKPSEYWVDPNSSFVRNYIIEIVKELRNVGFDEVQLDYIRFPTDGNQENRTSKYQIDSIEKEEVLNYFLKELKTVVDIPLSIDVYGLQGWYSYPGPQGQNIELFSKNIHTLSPMLYPSHFDKRFFEDSDPKRRAYNIVYYGTLRNVKKYPDLNIRPYIQAFTYGEKAYDNEYLMEEIKAVKDAGIDQFILWGLQFEDIDLIK